MNKKKRLLICFFFALLGMFFNWRVDNILNDGTVIKLLIVINYNTVSNYNAAITLSIL